MFRTSRFTFHVSRFTLRQLLPDLHHNRVALRRAGADGRDADAAAATAQFVDQGHDEACAAGPDGVAERDRAAVDVHFLRVNPQAAGADDGDTGEGFVDLHQV